MKVTLGGDRLGSGKKNKVEMSHYYRSSFNLEQDWKSSLAPGILYPCLNLIGTNGDTFDIDVDSFIRTLPTQGPLFGSFKMQVDIFACPFRLYQGILHNNPVDIGLKMSQVYLPKIKLSCKPNATWVEGADFYTQQISTSSLMKYLGLSGIGMPQGIAMNNTISRKFNAIPVLAYYDIFKNYYSNKQEENAYVLTPGTIQENATDISTITYFSIDPLGDDVHFQPETEEAILGRGQIVAITGDTLNYDIEIRPAGLNDIYTLQEAQEQGLIRQLQLNSDETLITFVITDKFYDMLMGATDFELAFWNATRVRYTSNIEMSAFPLENIDKMRNRILKLNELGDELVIDETEELLPYSTITALTEDYQSYNAFKQNGLLVKTYQSDLFNNWIQTDWIEGENGIAALSAVDVSGGSLDMDALNLAQKVYNMLNRIAVSGGTYEDWQEAVYDEKAVRKAESPMYMGGMSAEVMFEEVISTAETNVNNDNAALGTLGGKGTQVGKNGGNNIVIHCNEPTYIMGIISLTPRICQTQGNEWYLTELNSLNDLHKPGLDGIGFQDLIGEQMAWFDTYFYSVPGQQGLKMGRNSVGKVPAWINYQTAVDKAYGDFAEANGKAFMVLARNYEAEIGQDSTIVKDFTTYIDPSKYNYAFAYTDLASQNFWAQIHFKIIARRKMAAHQIPNL